MRTNIAAAVLLMCWPALGGGAGGQYVSVALHDVVDDGASGDEYAVTTANLVAFFEWLRGHDWTPITLDDIARAKSGARPLPDRAILVTFDDGCRSLYTRVYPLLLAYRIPVVASLAGSFIDADASPRKFISWAEAREMSRSGLVEFASHSYDLHDAEPANPRGSLMPAGAVRIWDPGGGYESEEEFRGRIRADLERSRSIMQRELGTSPRAFTWPYGRYTRPGQEEAIAAKFEFILTLDPDRGAPEDLPVVTRVLPSKAWDLRAMVRDELFGKDEPPAIRLVPVNPAGFGAADSANFERALGAAVERVRKLGANRVVVDAGVAAGDGAGGAWFPTRVVPVKADVLSRVVWQLRTRTGADVAVRMPLKQARSVAGSDAAVEQLCRDLGASSPADALMFEDVPALARIPLESAGWDRRRDNRARRRALDLSRLPPADALAMRCFFAFERERPGTRLYVLTGSPGATPSAVADLTLVEPPATPKGMRDMVGRLESAGWLAPPWRYRSGIWLRNEEPPTAAALETALRLFTRRGGAIFGWEPDDPVADRPNAAEAAPAVSVASDLRRF